MAGATLEQFQKWTEEEDLPPKVNCEDFYRQKLQKTLKKRAKELEPEQIEHIKCVFNNFVIYYELGLGINFRQIDASALLIGDDDIAGDDLKMSGLSDIVLALRKQLPEDKVLLNHEVKKIEMAGEMLTVSCEKGQYQAKHVIVTTALGFLKENAKSLFTPPLPAKKQEAIDKTGYGWVGKIFLQWDQPFWTKSQGTIMLAYTDEDRVMKSDREWYKCIHSFDRVINNDNVLVAWVAYDGVKIMEALSEDDVKTTITALLRKFLDNPSIPVPSKVKKTSWCSNRLFRGTYCYNRPDTKQQHWNDLEEPVCDKNLPRILFAGDSMRNNGCMHGARSSGLREAERLLGLYSLQKIPKLP